MFPLYDAKIYILNIVHNFGGEFHLIIFTPYNGNTFFVGKITKKWSDVKTPKQCFRDIFVNENPPQERHNLLARFERFFQEELFPPPGFNTGSKGDGNSKQHS